MITFDVGGVRFVYRTVGVAIDGGRVLLHQAEGDDFWSMPGGRVEPLEPSPDALRREMREEIGVAVRVERLLWVVENFYRHEALAYHELALFYLMSFPLGRRATHNLSSGARRMATCGCASAGTRATR